MKSSPGLRILEPGAAERDFHFEMQKHAMHLRVEFTARQLAIYELYRRTITLPGSIAEFGVRNGANFFYLARMIELFNPAQRFDGIAARHLYGFDTFAGFPSVDDKDRAPTAWHEMRVGGVNCDRDLFFRDYEAFRTASPIGSRMHILEGDVCATLPRFIQDNPGVRFSLLYLDLDLYEPTRVCLELLRPKLVPGAIVVFDEYAIKEFPGETEAADEFLAEHGLVLQSLPWCFSPAAFAVVE
jgi:3-O-methyltransferase